MMSAKLLESFDEVPPSDPSGEAYDQGFRDGQAAAEHLAQADQNRLSEELVQSIRDLEFSFAEARADLTAALAPVFAAICDKIFPAIIDGIYARKIADVISTAAQCQTPDRFQLAVHPDQSGAVQAAVGIFGMDLKVVPDAELGKYAARLDHAENAELFDAEHLVAEIAAILQTMTHTAERNRAHG
jgi:flagellar biosynthesis/type III secretory pathway protein FliH